MKIFIAALFAAAAIAQEATEGGEEAAPEKTVAELEAEFKGNAADFLSDNVQKLAFDAVVGEEGEASLSGQVNFFETAVGVQFVAMELFLSGAASTFADGTYQFLYFQVEEPIFPVEEEEEADEAAEARLLQDEEEEEEAATGTGKYEGFGIVAKSIGTTAIDEESGEGKWTQLVYFGYWGNILLSASKDMIFGQVAKPQQARNSGPWKVGPSNTYALEGEENAVVGTAAWRLASNDDHFVVKSGIEYTYFAGFKQYAKGVSLSSGKAAAYGDSEAMSFTFSGATTTISGFAAIAAGVVATMF